MRVGIGSDHAAVELRKILAGWLAQHGYEVVERGPEPGGSVDYPDIAHEVVEMLLLGHVERAVLVCGTGQGMAMAANAHVGVRAAVVSDVFSAEAAMLHNDARVLCMGGRVVGSGVALRCLEAWLNTTFEGGRHARRVGKIEPRELSRVSTE